jgi:hypothetical protein
MALDTNIRGISGTQADVDSNNNLGVQLPLITEAPGFASIAGRIDDGTVVSGGRTNRVYVTEGQSMKVAVGTLLWDDTFNSVSQNSNKYKFATTTQTVGTSNGFVILNGSSITTANSDSAIQTFRTFPLFAKSEIRCNTSGMITVAPQANAVTEFGLFSAVVPGRAAPTDGVFFRWNTAAELRGVINYNGTETQTAAITSPSINVNHDFTIVTQTNTVTFWIDDVLVGKLVLLTDAPANGQPFMAGAQPYTARYYIGASTPSLASQFKISDVFITYLGPDANRPWSHTKAGFGHMAYQTQNGFGGTNGSNSSITANNQALQAAAALTNTTAHYTGLGGIAHILPTLTVGTDGIVGSYQNPSGGVNQTPRNLVITGVWVSQAAVDVIFAGGPLFIFWTLCYGHTAVSLATSETATGKAPRRIPLGVQSFAATAAVNATSPGFNIQFQSPVVVAPGEFIAFVAKTAAGTVTTTGSYIVACGIDGYFE